MYRRNRRLVLEDDTDDLNAVRVNIPLSRVISTERTNLASFAGLITVAFDPSTSHDTSTEQAVPSAEDKEGLAVIDTAPERQVLQFGILREDIEWVEVKSHIDKAKASASSSNVDWPGSRVYIDVDPRTIDTETSDNNLSDRVKSVSYALGLDTTKDIWGTYCLFFFLFVVASCFPSVARAHLHRHVVCYSGRVAVNTECAGFWSKSITGADIRYRVPLSRIKNVKPHDRGRSRDHTLAIEIQGQHDLRLGFSTDKKRDDAIEQFNRFIGLSQERIASPLSQSPPSSTPYMSNDSLPSKRVGSLEQISESTASPDDTNPGASHRSGTLPPRSATSILAPISRVPSTVQKQHVPHALKSLLPKAVNVPESVLLSVPSKHFVCLTIGSRGDVQPYIALGRGLQKEGHKVTIVTHEEYKEWVVGFGIDHRTAGGDPGALMKLSVENKVFRNRLRPGSRTNASCV